MKEYRIISGDLPEMEKTLNHEAQSGWRPVAMDRGISGWITMVIERDTP